MASDGKSSPTALEVRAVAPSAPTAVTAVCAPPPQRAHANVFTGLLLLWQAAMLVLFATSASFSGAYAPGGAPAPPPARYAMWADTHTMMVVGFGLLYTLLRRYAWTGVSLNYLLVACVLQWAVLCAGFWENVRGRINGSLAADAFPSIHLSLDALIGADYTVAAVLISLGAVLGRLSPTQALWMAFFETIVVTGNNTLALHLGVSDAGGSMVIHCVGAAFGLGFIFGPAIGGLLTHPELGKLGYQLPIFAAATLCALAAIGGSRTPAGHRPGRFRSHNPSHGDGFDLPCNSCGCPPGSD
jgi:hypothetical protein